MSKKWELLGKVQSSKYRLKILQVLLQGEKTPGQLEEEIDIKFSHISRTLKELVDMKLVELLTPKLRKGKIYGLTSEGKKILGKIKN